MPTIETVCTLHIQHHGYVNTAFNTHNANGIHKAFIIWNYITKRGSVLDLIHKTLPSRRRASMGSIAKYFSSFILHFVGIYTVYIAL